MFDTTSIPQAPPMPPAPAGVQQGASPIPGLGNLAQRAAQPGMPDNAMSMLLFMAGMGFPEMVRSMDKLRGDKGKSHKQQGMQGDAAQSNGMAPPIPLAQMIARQAQMQKAMGALMPSGMAAGAPMPGGVPGMPGGLPGGTPF